jgi:predicted TIM-barrel fold metal-dependent hydrolase
MSTDIPMIISVDDHVVEPPELWQRWLPAKHRERGPRVVQSPYEATPPLGWPFKMTSSGPIGDFWVYEDLQMAITGGLAAIGRGIDDFEDRPVNYSDMRPGCFRVPERLDDMTINHVDRSLCFPTFSRFCGQTFLEAQDKDLALACVRAYNDWMVEEWAGESGGRLIPLCLVPLWDVDVAVAEVVRNAERGARSIAFSELPAHLGLPSIHDADHYWDPLFAACADTSTTVCMHIGSASQFLTSSTDAPNSVRMVVQFTNSVLALSDWLLSGVLCRHPELKIAFSEGQMGWVPYTVEGYKRSGLPPEMTEPPSTYAAGRVYYCFFEDDFGVAVRERIGIDCITFETDYPHQDSAWPDSLECVERATVGMSADEVYKIVRGNALRMLDLEESAPPSPPPAPRADVVAAQ